MEQVYYLYKITNNINGKIYIGITKRPEGRRKDHWNYRARYKGKTINILYQAMDKYGEENFSFEIICIGNKDYILDLEVKAIQLYKATEKEFGYNIKPGGESGRGYSTTSTGRDVPVFVSGWWFPSRRVACKALSISLGTYKGRQKEGTLGDIIRNKQLSKEISLFTYVGDFWFPSAKLAASVLNLKISTLRARISRGYIGSKRNTTPHNKGVKSLVPPSEHPSAKKVLVDFIEYGSIKEATESTGYSKYIINSRIKSGVPGFARL